MAGSLPLEHWIRAGIMMPRMPDYTCKYDQHRLIENQQIFNEGHEQIKKKVSLGEKSVDEFIYFAFDFLLFPLSKVANAHHNSNSNT